MLFIHFYPSLLQMTCNDRVYCARACTRKPVIGEQFVVLVNAKVEFSLLYYPRGPRQSVVTHNFSPRSHSSINALKLRIAMKPRRFRAFRRCYRLP